jgi:hypothetical protein
MNSTYRSDDERYCTPTLKSISVASSKVHCKVCSNMGNYEPIMRGACQWHLQLESWCGAQWEWKSKGIPWWNMKEYYGHQRKLGFHREFNLGIRREGVDGHPCQWVAESHLVLEGIHSSMESIRGDR